MANHTLRARRRAPAALAAGLIAALLVPAPSAEAYRLGRDQRRNVLTAPYLEARGKELRGQRNGVYAPLHTAWLAHYAEPADDLGVSANLFIRSQRGIVNRAAITAREGAPMPGRYGLSFPTGMFRVLHDELKLTYLRRLGLLEPVAAGLAAEIEREAVQLAGVDYAAYQTSLGVTRPSAADVRLALTTALDALFASSRIDVGFEVPYVAGYDRDDGAYVMIDCSVPLGPTLKGGFVPVAPLLTLHERIEKALLDEYGLRYQSAHQIALRTERASAAAAGVAWKPYDDMIADVANRIFERRPSRVSNRLDLTPYYSFVDAANRKLVGGINRALVDQSANASLLDKDAYRETTGRCPVQFDARR